MGGYPPISTAYTAKFDDVVGSVLFPVTSLVAMVMHVHDVFFWGGGVINGA